MDAPFGRSRRRLAAIFVRFLGAIGSVAAGAILVGRGTPPGLAVLTVIGVGAALVLLHRSTLRRRPHRQRTPVGGCHQIAVLVLAQHDEAVDAVGLRPDPEFVYRL